MVSLNDFLTEYFLLSYALIMLVFNLFVMSSINARFLLGVNVLFALVGLLFTIYIFFVSHKFHISSEYVLQPWTWHRWSDSEFMLVILRSTGQFFLWRPLFKCFALIVLFIFMILFYYDFKKIRPNFFELPIVLFIYILSVLLMFSFNHLFVLYLLLEIQTFCIIIIMSVFRYSARVTEALLKFFFLNSYSAVVFLFGLSVLYGLYGTLDPKELYLLMIFDNILAYAKLLTIFSIFCILLSLLFKLGAFPVNFWIADIYQGSSLFVIAFLSTITKLPYFYILHISMCTIFASNFDIIQPFLLCISLLTVLFGVIIGIYQSDFRRLVAYSTIINNGFLLMSLSIFTFDSYFSFLFMFCTYTLDVFNFTVCVHTFVSVVNYFKLRHIVDSRRLFGNSMLSGVFFSLIFISLAGIPPLAGFYGKYYLLVSVNVSMHIIFTLLLLLSIVGLVIIYFRIVRFILFSLRDNNDILTNTKLNFFFVLLMVFCVFLSLYFIIGFKFVVLFLRAISVGMFFF